MYFVCTLQIVHSILGSIATTGYMERLKPVHIYDVYCSGTEENILECPHNTINNPQSCLSYYNNDASVQCQGTTFFIIICISVKISAIIYRLENIFWSQPSNAM